MNTVKYKKTFLFYVPLCDAMATLLQPLVEVVIHDLATKTICHISGSLSGRQVGDSSLLDGDALNTDELNASYSKINFDGRLIKSISVPIEDNGLICINCDISIFSEMKKLSAQLLMQNLAAPPQSLFQSDWQERLHIAIHAFINEKKWQFSAIDNRQKKEIIKHLDAIGAFREKNAADYVAKTLSLGRATVFNYLREWRKS